MIAASHLSPAKRGETYRRTRRMLGTPARSPETRELRIALFTGNYNYIKDGVALTLNRLVQFLEREGVPVLILAPTAPKPAFESVGEVVSVPSLPIPSR